MRNEDDLDKELLSQYSVPQKSNDNDGEILEKLKNLKPKNLLDKERCYKKEGRKEQAGERKRYIYPVIAWLLSSLHPIHILDIVNGIDLEYKRKSSQLLVKLVGYPIDLY